MTLSHEQARLESVATGFLANSSLPCAVDVRPQGDGVGLTLTFEACGHTFIARGRLEAFASTQSIDFECCRLVRAFRVLWANTTGQADPENPDERCAGRWSPNVLG